ncbi:LacI family DNA-binding transcriptional regulator [Palleronia sediminis]|nr:LacI family DNA-binding transcriptional regulator [Palleronia sediminis]
MQKNAGPTGWEHDRPTTKDIARAAGVSRATVDRVLNGRDGVRQKTVDKVNAAIDHLGFVRNISAANLAKQRTYRFQFVLPRSGDAFLEQILHHVDEAGRAFATDMVRIDAHRLDENDPHRIAAHLSGLSPDAVDGIAIMAPQTPQVRDAILRLEERGIRALPFVSNQAIPDADWVGIDDRAAGRTAATLIGRFNDAERGRVLVVSESMQSRDSLERRHGFDEVLARDFPHLVALPSLETYGSEARASAIIPRAVACNPDIVAIYILSSEARVPLSIAKRMNLSGSPVTIAHERTPITEAALADGTLSAVIAQDPGHLVRSAIRKLRAMADRVHTVQSQERIRIEILLATNL